MHATLPHADHDSPSQPLNPPCSFDAVGLGDAGPDDLGDWWLDLGFIDLPVAVAV